MRWLSDECGKGNKMLVIHEGETVADIPVSALTDEAPLYERPMKESKV